MQSPSKLIEELGKYKHCAVTSTSSPKSLRDALCAHEQLVVLFMHFFLPELSKERHVPTPDFYNFLPLILKNVQSSSSDVHV